MLQSYTTRITVGSGSDIVRDSATLVLETFEELGQLIVRESALHDVGGGDVGKLAKRRESTETRFDEVTNDSVGGASVPMLLFAKHFCGFLG